MAYPPRQGMVTRPTFRAARPARRLLPPRAVLLAIAILAVPGGASFAAPTEAPFTEWDIQDPGCHNPEGLAFTDPLHGIVTGTRRTEPAVTGVAASPIRWTGDGGASYEGAEVPDEVFTCFSPYLVDQQRVRCLGRLTGGKIVLLLSGDGGRRWTSRPLPVTGWAKTVWFDRTELFGWLLSGRPALSRTQDGGDTWQANAMLGEADGYNGAMYAADDERLWVAARRPGVGQVIARTGDAGRTWQDSPVLYEGDDGYIKGIHFAPDGQSGWAVGMQGRHLVNGGHDNLSQTLVLHTTDGGATWEPQPLQTASQLSDVWALSPTEAWVCSTGAYALPKFAGGRLFHTTDAGATWQDESPASCSMRKLFFLDRTHGWVAGGAGGSSFEPARVVYRLTRIRD